MPATKNAFERHKVLDRCFRDRSKRYFMDDLIDIVNKDTYYYYGTEVSDRTIRKDISYMMDSKGYSAPIKKGMVGHKAYYYYSDPDFSIMNMPLTQEDMGRLEEMIRMLGRLKGLPNYLWIEETLTRLEDTFHLGERPDGIVAFDHNPYLRGMKHFEPLMDAIMNQKVLYVYYYKYRKTTKKREIHPYQLRQFNNRWFLIGMEPDMADKLPLVNLPLDRIDKFEKAKDVVYQTYQGMDFDEYFGQVVGVSVNIKAKKEKVVLKVGYPDAEYMISKPMHSSQKIIEQNENYVLIEMSLILNYEFETALLGFMNNCQIVEPKSLRNKIRNRAEEIVKNCK